MSAAEKMVRVTHGGESLVVPEAVWMQTADELVAKHGAGVPKVEYLDAPEPPRAKALSVVPPTVDRDSSPAIAAEYDPSVRHASDEPEGRGVGHVSLEGKIRSMVDLAAAREAGFSPADCYFERGTRVIEVGVENARSARIEYDAKPTVAAYCDELIAGIEDEDRVDVPTAVRALGMTRDGTLTVHGRPIPITRKAFVGLCNRLGFGGAWYLAEKCWAELRARNVNAHLHVLREIEDAQRAESPSEHVDRDLVFRTRTTSEGEREVFGVVTPSYTAFDVDRIAAALKEAAPADARGTVTYDGYRARFEVLFHTTVQPEKFVSGEFFRAGIIISTDDTGGGGLNGYSAVWQNLCLNLIMIDVAKTGAFNIRHIGDYGKLVAQFRSGFRRALDGLEHFRRAWGYAVDENIHRTARELQDDVPLTVEEAMPGFFRTLLDRELVPVRGISKKEAVPKLMEMWTKDESAAAGPTRAAVANAFTRFAHEVNTDPWAQDEIQRAAGRLIYSSEPIRYTAAER